jgi:hypothetical protein
MTVDWDDIGIKKPKNAVDLWNHTDVKVDGSQYKATVPSHGVVFLRTR